MSLETKVDIDLAHKIYQSILDGSGDAVVLGEFGRFLPFFTLPNVLESFEGRKTIETSEALWDVFSKIQSELQKLGAKQMERTCTVAQFDGPNRIRGMHETRLQDARGTMLERYSGMCTLQLDQGKWRIALSQFVEETLALPSKMLRQCADDVVTS